MPGRKAPVFRRNTPPVRIELRVPKFAGHSLFEFLRDKVLQTFGLVMQFVEGPDQLGRARQILIERRDAALDPAQRSLIDGILAELEKPVSE